ncbi:MAG: tyrosine-protein kinase family protein [Betaproteobacteria bacterium]|nr:tyrosine-protein kinase family protein [Betaproteobacteria bacterium]
MSLIEQAVKRLDELRRAGFGTDAPDVIDPQSSPAVSQPAPSAIAAAPVEPAVRSASFPIDMRRLAAMGLVSPEDTRSRIAEEFRVIKRPLLANANPAGGSGVARANLIMITSSLPGEGKSFSAFNLAMSIAMELDRSVLLVDADVIRPSLPTLLGLRQSPGLLDLLSDPSVRFSDVHMHTGVEKLSFIPSGNAHPRAAEMLASNAMTSLVGELATRYPDRIIIFDSPPLLVTTESRVLATQMGQIVFVVRAERTLQRDVTQALATIESCPLKLLLLNGAPQTPDGSYSYGYGYGYGQGPGAGK